MQLIQQLVQKSNTTNLFFNSLSNLKGVPSVVLSHSNGPLTSVGQSNRQGVY